ncbi:putative elongation factor Tu [Toxoplasma gondii RUB]|uniref:G1 to S phase transition protein, putative n=9 Tax=Toxoplasma gondii TaxID=5811 RepID=B9QIG0_TOXGV|nr:putative elongation factor Tu [Toxoplasma gondii VEG]KFG32651.1 putative elongation factor Tu [Toxoplasma gondii GAB2-2007-GAL-DOM2]KFG43317.1 putative elongation factor Tu [Toxoplasma gondii FOU]KFG43972.1 putative elongation factor Tu [Toxoplasma gondii p89]KFG58793.1 putative elongation factor Tu [Toxoplasma gondii RUB]KFH03833.1 putative elongation factor Tu [Toxoplasma gondii VAND]KFH11125.1 putative elongation factor Tu [Toxoplasma gondii MAS]PUA88587.1 putative elongation factor Tu
MSGFVFNPNASVFVPGGVSSAPPPPPPASEDPARALSCPAAQAPAASLGTAPNAMTTASVPTVKEVTEQMEHLQVQQKESCWSDEADDRVEDTGFPANEEKAAETAPAASAAAAQQPAGSPEGVMSKAQVREAAAAAANKKNPPDSRPHLNIVFIGHVDAGKSTTCGNILYLTGGVDERTIEKYEKEAKEKNRESWFLAFVMDTNEEERQKGKTVEVGRAFFSTPNRRFTLLDAPGHKAFVPNMIEGAAQADIGVLIISARKGEFETGFEKGGQTREHALLAKTLGVNQLVIAVNKMDEPTCGWSQARFEEIEKKLTPFLKSCGFNPAKDIFFIPISGLHGQNLKDHVSRPGTKAYDARASWYGTDRPSLFELFDSVPLPDRKADDPLRVPILDGYKDGGVVALGKVEAGTLMPGMNCVLMPFKNKVKVTGVFIEDDEVAFAKPGENVRIKLMGVDEDQLGNGMMLCPVNDPCPVVTSFVGRLGIVELLEHRPLVTAGYSCVLHAHTAREEVVLNKLLEVVDKKTKKKKNNPQFVKNDCMVTVEVELQNPICLEEFEKMPQLGRFTLRDEGKTIGIGRVLQILKTA